MLKFTRISKDHTLYGVVPLAAVEISCISTRAYAWRAVIVRPNYKQFLLSNFAGGNNIQFTNCISSNPILSIPVTETVVEAQGSLWRVYVGRQKGWDSKVEVSRVKPTSFQHVLLQHKRLLLLFRYLWQYNRYFVFTHDSRTHPTLNCREDVQRQILVYTIATMNASTMAKWQLSP